MSDTFDLTRRQTFLASAALLAACSDGDSVSSVATDPELADYALTLMKASGTPGLTLAYGTGDQPSLNLNLGVTNAETLAPVIGTTLFPAASVSKLVFAYAVLLLSSDGSFDLDAPLKTHVKPAYLPAAADLDSITARDVLSHRSGLPNWVDDDPTWEDTRPLLRGKFRYSGEGYFWLQLAIEKMTGVGLDTFMRKQLFEPAQMNSSAFIWGSQLAKRVAYGHESARVANDQGLRDVLHLVEPLADEWEKPLSTWTHEDWLAAAARVDPSGTHTKITFANAAASMVTTASDLYKCMRLLLPHSSLGPQLPASLHSQMTTPTVQVVAGLNYWWGLGCAVEPRSKDHSLLGHEGNNGSYRAYAGMQTDTKKTLVVLTNGDNGHGVYERLARRLMEQDQLSFVANLNPNHELTDQ
ncbi:MAG: serine hydrolase domain-containing protein [Pseudomonadota bacterium]